MQLSLFPENHDADTEALRRCMLADVVAIDIETDTHYIGEGPNLDYGLSYHAAVTVIGLAWVAGGTIQTTALAAPFEASSIRFLCDLFATDKWVVAHNAVFDMRQLSKLTKGIVPKNIWDTQSMARLLSPKVDARYSLLGVATALDLAIPNQQQKMKTKRSQLHLLPLEQKVQYAQDDAKLSLEIYLRQKAMPQDSELVDWECRFVHELAVMAARGIRLNRDYVERYLEDLNQERNTVTERLFHDGLTSPRNSKARAKYLYVTKGIPLPQFPEDRRFFTRAGRRRHKDNPDTEVTFRDLSTSSYIIEEYLEQLPQYQETLQDLTSFLSVDWLISTLEGLVKHAAFDGRLHSLVTIATDTGRRASSNPHMQNWKMPAMAGVAIADDGATLLEIDYRNAENIMAALISGDDNLAAACDSEDFHSTMAEQYFGDRWCNANVSERKDLRNWSKKITYGTNYGMGARSLGRSLGVSQEEARQWIHAKDRAFSSVTRMRAKAQRQTNATHQLNLWTGRPVSVPTAFVAWNYLCQGGVSEIVKRAIVRVSDVYRERGLQSRVALDMHDALILEVRHDEWQEAIDIATHIMQTITPPELNARTTPPIRWGASPDFEENAKKWGAQQWHPID